MTLTKSPKEIIIEALCIHFGAPPDEDKMDWTGYTPPPNPENPGLDLRAMIEEKAQQRHWKSSRNGRPKGDREDRTTNTNPTPTLIGQQSINSMIENAFADRLESKN